MSAHSDQIEYIAANLDRILTTANGIPDAEARMEQQGQKHAHYLTEAGFEKYIGGDE